MFPIIDIDLTAVTSNKFKNPDMKFNISDYARQIIKDKKTIAFLLYLSIYRQVE